MAHAIHGAQGRKEAQRRGTCEVDVRKGPLKHRDVVGDSLGRIACGHKKVARAVGDAGKGTVSLVEVHGEARCPGEVEAARAHETASHLGVAPRGTSGTRGAAPVGLARLVRRRRRAACDLAARGLLVTGVRTSRKAQSRNARRPCASSSGQPDETPACEGHFVPCVCAFAAPGHVSSPSVRRVLRR